MRRRVATAVAIGALAGVALGQAQAPAAIPKRGTVLEGVGPSGLAIGTPIAVAKRRFQLVCARTTAAFRITRCYDSPRHAVNWLDVAGDGRIEAVNLREGAWRTRRGVGLGSRVGAVTRAYGARLKVRRTTAWTYIDLFQQVGGQRRDTFFLASSRTGEVVALTVTQARVPRIAAGAPAFPPEQDPSLRVSGFEPGVTVSFSIRAPWMRFPRDVPGSVRIGNDGTAVLPLPRAGVLASVLPERPGGTASPVRLTVLVDGIRGLKADVLVALPPPPVPSISPSALSDTGPAQMTLAGPEPGINYVVDAEWACPAGGSRRATGVGDGFARSAAPLVIPIDASLFTTNLFSTSCAGSTPPASLPATLVVTRSRVGGGSERLATLAVSVLAPAP